MKRRVKWVVSDDAPRDTAQIPTKGNPTTVMDLTRVVGLYDTNYDFINPCITDVESCIGLANLIEGELRSFSELQAAESALQMLMWHDNIDILVPGFKMINESLSIYQRSEKERSKLCFELFKPCNPHDIIYTVETVKVHEQKVVKSTLGQDSQIVGKNLSKATSNYLFQNTFQSKVYKSLPASFKVPAYFNNKLQGTENYKGMFEELYPSIHSKWSSNLSNSPMLEYKIVIPPLTAIVLDRAKNRNDIPEVINNLRKELAGV